MPLAYLILAHKNPGQLKRLISRLHNPNDYFYIHIDSKVDIKPFENELSDTGYNVQFIKKREDARWGDMGLVLATLNGLKEITASEIQFTHVSLLSGQDYPIQPQENIRNFFKENKAKSFIEAIPFPVQHLKYGGLHRVYSYSFNIGKSRETYIPLKWKNSFNWKGQLLNLALGTYCLFLPKREFPFGWKPYFGSQWWSLNIEAVCYILQFVEENPFYLKFHRHSQIPDEMFFQSLIVNNPKLKFVNDNLRFIVWESGSSHPKTLALSDSIQIQSSGKLFARKFEPNNSILNKIDKKINKKKV